jgi:phenylalanyl-tRNA synthetase beta subunit
MSRQEILDEPSAVAPQAAQFLAAYFHQDWVLDRDGWEEVVDDFVAESPRRAVTGCAADLRALLGAGLNDEEVARVLEELGCSVEPSAYGLTPGAWLAAVLARLERPG